MGLQVCVHFLNSFEEPIQLLCSLAAIALEHAQTLWQGFAVVSAQVRAERTNVVFSALPGVRTPGRLLGHVALPAVRLNP